MCLHPRSRQRKRARSIAEAILSIQASGACGASETTWNSTFARSTGGKQGFAHGASSGNVVRLNMCMAGLTEPRVRVGFGEAPEAPSTSPEPNPAARTGPVQGPAGRVDADTRPFHPLSCSPPCSPQQVHPEHPAARQSVASGLLRDRDRYAWPSGCVHRESGRHRPHPHVRGRSAESWTRDFKGTSAPARTRPASTDGDRSCRGSSPAYPTR